MACSKEDEKTILPFKVVGEVSDDLFIDTVFPDTEPVSKNKDKVEDSESISKNRDTETDCLICERDNTLTDSGDNLFSDTLTNLEHVNKNEENRGELEYVNKNGDTGRNLVRENGQIEEASMNCEADNLFIDTLTNSEPINKSQENGRESEYGNKNGYPETACVSYEEDDLFIDTPTNSEPSNKNVENGEDLEYVCKNGETGTPCVSCGGDRHEISARCVDCNGFLCQQCVKLHETITPLKVHTVLTIDEPQSENTDMNIVIQDEHCPKHTDEIFKWFCNTCSSAICNECKEDNHVGPDHDCITIDSANEIQVNEIIVLMESCIGLTEQLTNAIVNADEVESNLTKSVDNIMKKIDAEKKAYLDPIERSFKEIMDLLSQIQAKKIAKISHTKRDLESKKSKLNDAVQMASQIITSGSKHDLPLNYTTLHKTLADLKATKVVEVARNVGEIKYTSRKQEEIKPVDFGTISENDKSKWVLAREIGKKSAGKIKSGFGVCVSRNKYMYIADWSDKNVKIFDSNGDFKGVLQGNLTRPHDIAVTPDGAHQYVSDCTGLVNVFNSKGRNVQQFSAISPDGKASDSDGGSQLCGLAVDNDGNLLVGNTDLYISKHRPDGSHINSFKTDIPPSFITVTRQGNIIVCPKATTINAEILDDKGKLLSTIKKPHDAKSWCPCSCCCSDDGIVYITSCYGRSTVGGIYSFTEDGKYLGCVTKDVWYTGGIALVDDDTLVVAQSYDLPTKIFRHKGP